MTTIATDGKSMAGDGQCEDHYSTIVNSERRKVYRLADGRIAGAAGNSFDINSWIAWIGAGKEGECPIDSDNFAALILSPDGILWVDHKGRETPTPAPIAIGSGQDYAIGAMEAGATPQDAVSIACKRDPCSGGIITVEQLKPQMAKVA